MIQRIQTVFLALLIIVGGLMLVFPFVEYTVGNTTYVFDAQGMEITAAENAVPFPIYMLIFLVMALAMATIFLYKKRDIQIKLGSINFFVILGLTGLLYYYAMTLHKVIPVDQVQLATDMAGDALPATLSYKLGLFLPIVMLILAFLANRGIRKDEALVKSFDRLR